MWALIYLLVSVLFFYFLFFYLNATKSLQIVGLTLTKTCLCLIIFVPTFKLVDEWSFLYAKLYFRTSGWVKLSVFHINP